MQLQNPAAAAVLEPKSLNDLVRQTAVQFMVRSEEVVLVIADHMCERTLLVLDTVPLMWVPSDPTSYSNP